MKNFSFYFLETNHGRAEIILDMPQSLRLSSLLLDKEVFWKLIQRRKLCTQLNLNPDVTFPCSPSENATLYKQAFGNRIQAGHAVQMTTFFSPFPNLYSVFWGLFISKISNYEYSASHRVGQLTTGRMQLKQLPAAHRAAPAPASGHPFLLLSQKVMSHKSISDLLWFFQRGLIPSPRL